MLYLFMVKHRPTGNLVAPVQHHATSQDMAVSLAWEEIKKSQEFDNQTEAKELYELVPVDKIPKQWFGVIPTNCDLCHQPLKGGWVDGKTSLGPWANMCVPKCFKMYGPRKLGTGFGQRYDGNGWKVEG